MFRSVVSAIKNVRCFGSLSTAPIGSFQQLSPISRCLAEQVTRNYCVNTSVAAKINSPSLMSGFRLVGLLQPKSVLTETVRTNIKFSRTKGKRRTVMVVLKKFFRLNWGCWIHAKCGKHKRLYKKSAARRRRLQYHVFCNGKQSYLLDKMVTAYWRRPKYYVDDPYEPYQTREEYKYTRKKPYQPFV